jgi:hypothetical protein
MNIAKSQQSFIKTALKHTPVYSAYRLIRANRIKREWVRGGKPVPPPSVLKQEIIRSYAKKFQLPVFIETGTYMGETVAALAKDFEEIHSIELQEDLYQTARRQFGDVLGELLNKVHRPALFWLDGHYSGGITAGGNLQTPIQKELAHISRHSLALAHVILIDDARLWVGENDYPEIDFLHQWVRLNGFQTLEIADDIIRIHA